MDRILTAATSPEGAELNDIPVLRSFVGDAANDRRSLSQQYYSIAESVVPTAQRMRAIENPESAEQVRAARESIDMDQVPLVEIVDAAEKELRRLRRYAKTATPEQRERIAEVRRKVQATVVRRANEIDQRE
jgi:ABC-type transporter MlaC component